MSGTALIIALILMTADHIGAYIPNMPLWLKWIGRLSSPLFSSAPQRERCIQAIGADILKGCGRQALSWC